MYYLAQDITPDDNGICDSYLFDNIPFFNEKLGIWISKGNYLYLTLEMFDYIVKKYLNNKRIKSNKFYEIDLDDEDFSYINNNYINESNNITWYNWYNFCNKLSFYK